jgi:hypothetical protein
MGNEKRIKRKEYHGLHRFTQIVFKKKELKRILKEKKGVFKMTPLDNSFENLLLKKIPDLTREEIDRYDNVLALSQDLRMLASVTHSSEEDNIKKERDKQKKEGDVSKDKLDQALTLSYQILTPYWRRYRKLHGIWLARKTFALCHGDLLQIPTNWDRLKKFLKNYIKYLLSFFRC